MKQEKKNVTKRLSKEASIGNSSFGDYHREEPVSIPFIWESEPGTPKHKFHERPLPPLTPPPSYQCHVNKSASRQSRSGNLIHTLFPRISSRKSVREASYLSSFPSSPSSSQWSSSSSSDKSFSRSTPSSPAKYLHGRRREHKISFDSMGEEVEEEEEEYSKFPVSALCYRVGNGGTNRAPYRGCCSAMRKIFS